MKSIRGFDSRPRLPEEELFHALSGSTETADRGSEKLDFVRGGAINLGSANRAEGEPSTASVEGVVEHAGPTDFLKKIRKFWPEAHAVALDKSA